MNRMLSVELMQDKLDAFRNNRSHVHGPLWSEPAGPQSLWWTHGLTHEHRKWKWETYVWASGRNEDKQRRVPKSWTPPVYYFAKCFLALCLLFGMCACGKDISGPLYVFSLFFSGIGPILSWAHDHTKYRPYFQSHLPAVCSHRTKFWPMGYDRKWHPQVLGDRGHFLSPLPIQHCNIGMMASAPSWTIRMRNRSLSWWNRKLETRMAQMILEPSQKAWTAHTQTFHERSMHSIPFYHV